MFTEFTTYGSGLTILLNVDEITAVYFDAVNQHRVVHMRQGNSWYVSESYEEIKKRLGLVISPRAETLAIR